MVSKFKAATTTVSASTHDENSYWIMPEGSEPTGCTHDEAKQSRNTKRCKECGAIRYKRVSDFIKGGDTPPDYENLKLRDTRYAIKGILANPAYIAQAEQFDVDNDTQDFNKLTKRAARDAGIWTKASWGTAVHAWTEDVDNGHSSRFPLADKPDLDLFGPAMLALSKNWKDAEAFRLFNTQFKQMRKDVQAYMVVSEAHGMKFTHSEAIVVLDEYEVAGKLDRLGNVAEWSPLYCCEKPHVDDTKTGSIKHGKRSKVMQFGSYARGKLYDPKTYARVPHGACTKTAYVMHIPKGDPGLSKLVRFDISRAGELLDLAHSVWKAHSWKNSLKESGVEPWLTERISSIMDEQELTEFYERTHQFWNEDHEKLAESKQFNNP